MDKATKKYIPADKLIAEIERLLARANRRTDKEHLSHNSEMEKFGEDYWNGYGDLAYSLLGYVDSLQQEQPKLPGYNKALLEVKSKVDELYEETSIGLSEYDSGLYNGIAETCMKLRGFIKARLED